MIFAKNVANNCECGKKHTHMEKNGNLQEEYAALARYVYRKGVRYKAQAARLGIHPNTFSSLRKDARYVHTVTDEHIEAFKREFSLELAGFGQPSPLDLELQRLQAKLDQKDEVIARLSALLDPAAAQALLEKIQEITARLEEE